MVERWLEAESRLEATEEVSEIIYVGKDGGLNKEGGMGRDKAGPFEGGLGDRTDGPGKERNVVSVRLTTNLRLEQQGEEDNPRWRKSQGGGEVTLGGRCP